MQSKRLHLATLFLVVMCVAGVAHAAKSAHIDGRVSTALQSVSSPQLQNLSDGPITIGKTLLEQSDYGAVETTLTLNLSQDFKGSIVGTADFVTTGGSAENHSFPIVGKAKSTKKGAGFTLAGATSSEVISTAPASSKISVKATLISPTLPSPPVLDPVEQKTTATYDLVIKITGLSRTYTYAQTISVYSNANLSYRLADDSESNMGVGSDKFDYILLNVPWGVILTKGTLKGADGGAATLSVKAPKFTMLIDGQLPQGQPFVPATVKQLKTAYGKHP